MEVALIPKDIIIIEFKATKKILDINTNAFYTLTVITNPKRAAILSS